MKQDATQVLDKNHTGLISIQQIAKAPVLLRNLLVPSSVLKANNTKATTNALIKIFGTSNYVSIEKQIQPALIKYYENEQLSIYSNAITLLDVQHGLDRNQI